MNLNELRLQIDQINGEMRALFEKRMALCAEVAAYKKTHGMEVFVPEREAAILQKVRAAAAPGMEEYDAAFFDALLALSRAYQEQILQKTES